MRILMVNWSTNNITHSKSQITAQKDLKVGS